MKNLQQDQDLSKDQNNLIIYQSNDGDISFNVKVLDETIWLTQKQMAELLIKVSKPYRNILVTFLKKMNYKKKWLSEFPEYHSARCYQGFRAEYQCKIL